MTGNRGQHRRQIVHTAIIVATGILAIVGVRQFAPSAWEIMTYAQSYARGHVAAGYLDQGQADWFVASAMLRTLMPLGLLVLCPVLVGLWLSRRR